MSKKSKAGIGLVIFTVVVVISSLVHPPLGEFLIEVGPALFGYELPTTTEFLPDIASQISRQGWVGQFAIGAFTGLSIVALFTAGQRAFK